MNAAARQMQEVEHVRRLVAESRAAQGLAEHVEDQVVLDRVAGLLRDNADTKAGVAQLLNPTSPTSADRQDRGRA